MKEFIDKTSEQDGTPLNRKNMMAMQGFIGKTIIFEDETHISEVNSDGESKVTRFNSDGSITIIFGKDKTITKTIIFNSDGSITEVIE